MKMDPAGRHLLLDLYNCDFDLTHEQIKEQLAEVCEKIGATVLASFSHLFNNGGSSGAVILAESHCTWHYWIDEKFLALDIFVCGDCDPLDAFGLVEAIFRPKSYWINQEFRGLNYNKD